MRFILMCTLKKTLLQITDFIRSDSYMCKFWHILNDVTYWLRKCISSTGINFISKFIEGGDSDAQKVHLTEQVLEESIDKALAKADYNWDGYISWDEYVYSLGDNEVSEHVREYDEHHNDSHI